MRFHLPTSLPVVLICLVWLPSRPAPAAPEKEETDRFDAVVKQFILYDVGELRGQEGQRAWKDFNDLTGDHAIPALVRGVNQAARMRQSCPIIVIAGKLQAMLQSTKDRSMLQYAAEDLNSSGTGVHYASYVERLREMAETRLHGPERNRDLRGGTASQLLRANKPVDQWSLEDLQEAIYQERGATLVSVLEELMKRKGGEHTEALAAAIGAVPEDMKEVARGLLAQRLVRMTDRTLRAKLEDPDAEVRAATVRAIGYKGSPLYEELVAAMRDKPMVAEHAHQALVKLSGQDLGPAAGAPAMEWYRASKRWEEWAEQQKPAEVGGAP